MAAEIEIQLLGPMTVRVDGQTRELPKSRKTWRMPPPKHPWRISSADALLKAATATTAKIGLTSAFLSWAVQTAPRQGDQISYR